MERRINITTTENKEFHVTYDFVKKSLTPALKLTKLRKHPYRYQASVGPGQGKLNIHAIHEVTGDVVGEINWFAEDGFVMWLGVDEKHRAFGHTCLRLLMEAWEFANNNGHVGPQGSDDLTNFSRMLMRRWVPDSPYLKSPKYLERWGEKDRLMDKLFGKTQATA